MSHFAVLVIGENVEEQLDRYDENKELPMHLYRTKEQMILDKRAWIENYKNGLYAEYLQDPEAYVNSASEAHIKYITEQFPKMLEWTDEQCYEDEISEYREYIENGSQSYEIKDNGDLWSIFNEEAKWDWYQMGGRYRGVLKLKEPSPEAPLYDGWQHGCDKAKYQKLREEGFCDQARVKDIANLDEVLTFAVVKDGKWYERGEMGWWAIVSNEKDIDTWEGQVRALLKDLPGNTLITIVDCHI